MLDSLLPDVTAGLIYGLYFSVILKIMPYTLCLMSVDQINEQLFHDLKRKLSSYKITFQDAKRTLQMSQRTSIKCEPYLLLN